MDNITEGQKGLMSYGCGYSADPCMQVSQLVSSSFPDAIHAFDAVDCAILPPQPLKGDEIKYPGFDTKLHNLPNDWSIVIWDSCV